MKSIRQAISTILIITIALPFYAQDTLQEDYFDTNYLRYQNHTYRKNIKTIQLHKENWELSYPVIKLKSDEKLVLSFDDLDADVKNYSYTFEHCNAKWESSNLLPNEFIDGFPENEIRNYEYSFNTTYQYTHYSLTFPNEDIDLLLSGNYVIKVYLDYNKDSLVLTRRFSIVEHKTEIIPLIKQATLIDKRKYCHEIDFTIKHSGYNINDPFGELSVVITQNNRWDNAKYDLKPLFVKDNELVYDYDMENVFMAGSEFRNFDIKSIRYQSQYISQIEYVKPYYHIRLLNDEVRRFKIYFSEKDINGKYYIKYQEGEDSNVEADYVFVYFTLPYEAPMIDGNFYVFGALSDWNFNETNQMFYNFEKKAYQLKMLLKQGYYNYQYVYVKDGSTQADHTFIEGSHYETENDYIIYVYHRDISSRYDKLIGFEIANSVIKNRKK